MIGIDKIQKRVNDIGEKAPYDVTGDGRSLRNHPHWDAGAGGGSRRLSWWGRRGDMQWNWGERSAISWCHGRRLELTRTPALGRQCRRREQKAVLTRASAAIDRLYACSNWFRWRYAMYKRHKIRGFYFTARHWTTNMHPGFITDIGGIRIFFVHAQSHIVLVNIPPRYQHFHQLRDKPRRTSKQLQSALSRSSYTSQPLTSAIATIDSRI